MNDDTLILYYYDELSPEQRAEVDTALDHDLELKARYRELCRSLDSFDPEPQTPARPSPQSVARWHRSIEDAAGSTHSTPRRDAKRWHFPSFAWGALAAAVILAAGMRVWFDEPPPTFAPQPEDEVVAGRTPPPSVVPASFARGLKVHLRDSRRNLLRLAEDDAGERQLLLMDIMRQNRQFERAALDNNAEDVARVLRAFEPILQRLASEELATEDAAALKAKLAFELNVVLTKIAVRESQDTKTI